MDIGIIGCGNIAPAYLKTLPKFGNVRVAALADLDLPRAQARAQEFAVPRACTVDELLADPSIGVVINLTIPKVHVTVGKQVVAAGKHHYCEKPLGLDRDEARGLLAAAASTGVRLGCAPDTVLGGGTQTCRKLIDDGAIGTPVAGVAFMLCPGHESWHPDPGFYYQRGGGPMFDMGPYYLSSLINLLGPVRRVTGSARVTRPTRTISSQPKNGTVVTVEVPTHVAAVLDFVSGAVVTLVTSFDVFGHSMPNIEIYGSEGSLSVPDPNSFGGTVRLRKGREKEWIEVPLTHGWSQQSRGLGVADLAAGITAGRPHRANADVAFHVLDIMQAVHESSATGRHIELTSTCLRPLAMPAALDGALD